MSIIHEWSKVALAFAVGVSLSAGYVALGIQGAPPTTVVVEERCTDQAPNDFQHAPAQEATAALDPELVRDPPYYGMAQARLLSMAKTCELRDDHATALDEETAKTLGLDADEREAWAQALAGMEGKEAARHFILLNAIDPEIDVSKLDVATIRATLLERVGETKRPEDRSVYRQLAEERAGLRKAPSKAELREQSAWARWTRWDLTRGDRFAALLAEPLGEARVEQLRATFGGWPGQDGTQREGCEDSPENLIEDYSASEGLDKAIIARIVRAHIPEVRSCYKAGLDKDPELAGKVLISFAINTEGKVSRTDISGESTLGDAKTERCIADAVGTWRFPRPRGDSEVIVTYPFVLEPG